MVEHVVVLDGLPCGTTDVDEVRTHVSTTVGVEPLSVRLSILHTRSRQGVTTRAALVGFGTAEEAQTAMMYLKGSLLRDRALTAQLRKELPTAVHVALSDPEAGPPLEQRDVSQLLRPFGALQRLCGSKGWYVGEFTDGESAIRAICGLDGVDVGHGAVLRCNLFRPGTATRDTVWPLGLPVCKAMRLDRGAWRQPKSGVWVGGLQAESPELFATMRSLFVPFGTILNLTVKDRSAYIDFEQEDAARKATAEAVLCNGAPLDVRVNAAAGRFGTGRAEVFVGGLPDEVSEDALRGVLTRYGSVDAVRASPNFAFVDFTSLGDAVRACTALDNTDIIGTGRPSGVRVNKTEESLESYPASVFLGGMPPGHFTEEDVRTLFEPFGSVIAIRMGDTIDVDFQTVVSAVGSCSMTGMPLGEEDGVLSVRMNKYSEVTPPPGQWY